MWLELALKLHDEATDADIKRLQDDLDAAIRKHEPSLLPDSTGIVNDWKWDL